MEHLADEFDGWGFVWILLLKLHYQPEGAILKRRVGGPNNDGVPISVTDVST